MPSKTQQLQIRVSADQKRTLKRLAREAGQGMSGYVLSRVLPQDGARFESLLAGVADEEHRRFALAELNDLLADLPPGRFPDAVEHADVSRLSPYLQNYVAAMVELAAHQRSVAPPPWMGRVPPLDEPHFATPMASLRPHLLKASPVPFKRRNIFIDASIGDRA